MVVSRYCGLDNKKHTFTFVQPFTLNYSPVYANPSNRTYSPPPRAVRASCLHQNRLTVFGGARLTSAGRGCGAAVDHRLGRRVGWAAVHVAVSKLDVTANSVRHHGSDGVITALKLRKGELKKYGARSSYNWCI